MSQVPETKEGEPLWETVLYIFYIPTKGGQFMFEYKSKPNLRVCLPEVGIDKREIPWTPLIRKIKRMEMNPKRITALPDFIEPNSNGKNVNYHPFLIQGWEGEFKNNVIPLWADYATALSFPELRASDRKALALAQEVIKAKEEQIRG